MGPHLPNRPRLRVHGSKADVNLETASRNRGTATRVCVTRPDDMLRCSRQNRLDNSRSVKMLAVTTVALLPCIPRSP